MAVTPHTSGTIPIRGKSYTLPQSFTAQHGKDGKTDSEGNGGADGLTAGKTYYITQYATIKGTDTLTSWPYAISPTSKNEPLGWWQADLFPVATYTIKYRANYSGGTNPDDQTKTWGTPLTLRSAITRTGYTFGGWNTNNSGTGTNYAAGASYKSDSAVTLYAKWTANTYTVKYNANGGTGSMSNSSHSYDAAKNLTANGFTRTGYHFAGWSETASGSVVYDNQESVTNLTSTNGGTINLYAQWTTNKLYIQYNANGGTLNSTGYMANEDDIICKKESFEPYEETWPYNSAREHGLVDASYLGLEKTGHTFEGWTVGADGNEIFSSTDSELVPTRFTDSIKTNKETSVIMFAHWGRNQYQLTLDANGGKVKDDLTYSYNVYYEYPLALNDEEGLPTPIRPGYDFVGWNTQQDGKGFTLAGDAKMSAEDLILYAQWEPAASIVTIYVDGNKRRGMVHMYNDEGQLCYGIMTIYNENRVGHFAG